MEQQNMKPVQLNELRSIFDMLSLKGKVAFVTGAAGGIGRSTAAALAEAGADVALMDINQNESMLNEISSYITNKHGVRTITLTGDVSDEGSVQNLYNEIIKKFGTVDIIHSNAGIATPDDKVDMDIALWKRMLDINYTGMFIVAREGAKIMKAHKHGGSIILTASMSATVINRRPENAPYSIGYTTTKAATKQLAKVLAMEFLNDGIRVNSISPGYICSGMKDGASLENIQYKASCVPMKRFGTLNEIIGSVVYLASDLGSYHTGSDILIDGGYSVW